MNDFSGHEAELLVVVEDGVHVLDPQSVDRSVENDPLVIRSFRGRELAEDVGDDTWARGWKR